MHQNAHLLCSVIIPVYNGQATVLRCLDGLARQTISLERFEVIVVDDGSTDGTKAVVEEWIASHGLAHWQVVSQSNGGPGAARNHGAEIAQSPLLLFTDADCAPSAGWVMAMTEPFLGINPPVAVMGSYLSQQTEPAARFAQYEFEDRYRLMASRVQIDLVATYAAAYERKLFLQMGGFDISFPKANNEDVEFSYRLSRTGARMIFVPEAAVAHSHSHTWGRYFKTKIERAYWRVQVYRRYPEKAVADSYTPQSLKVQLVMGVASLLGLLVAGATVDWYWLIPVLLFLAAAMPTALSMTRGRHSFLLWALWGLWLRSLAFAVGVIWGFLRPYSLAKRVECGTSATIPVPNE